jgi:hypothetical protein
VEGEGGKTMKREILFLGTCWIDGIEDRSNYWIQVDPATVEQFIGLTDKYSRKIIFYERSMLL